MPGPEVLAMSVIPFLARRPYACVHAASKGERNAAHGLAGTLVVLFWVMAPPAGDAASSTGSPWRKWLWASASTIRRTSRDISGVTSGRPRPAMRHRRCQDRPEAGPRSPSATGPINGVSSTPRVGPS